MTSGGKNFTVKYFSKKRSKVTTKKCEYFEQTNPTTDTWQRWLHNRNWSPPMETLRFTRFIRRHIWYLFFWWSFTSGKHCPLSPGSQFRYHRENLLFSHREKMTFLSGIWQKLTDFQEYSGVPKLKIDELLEPFTSVSIQPCFTFFVNFELSQIRRSSNYWTGNWETENGKFAIIRNGSPRTTCFPGHSPPLVQVQRWPRPRVGLGPISVADWRIFRFGPWKPNQKHFMVSYWS